ncbi:MAG TPA: bifunctional phosphoglucose/phosphomannose isomerase [Microthrixaceae bacterium]|nr:bifunctional phosphoglucose/phosphomannose isomerase [Microthrixaceae bacterium]
MRVHELDSLNMFAAASGLADQIEVAARTAGDVDLPDARGINSVVVMGMGGSGIGGDLTAAIAGPDAAVPVIVPKGYEAPAFIGPETLVFAVSFSGNTEETIEAATRAHKQGARLVVLANGGQLASLAGEWGATWVRIADGIPMPRAGIGAVSVPPLVILGRLGLIHGIDDQITSAVAQLRRRAAQLDVENSPAAKLARRIGRTMPITYGGGLLGEVAAARWKGQFNENCKIPAFENRIPELTHNEICGWGQHGDVTRQMFSLVMVRHDYEHAQTRRRFELVEEICDEVVADIHTVSAEGDTRLAQLFDLVLFGDYVTLELAVQAGVDPGPVPILDEIKARLRN